MLYIILALFFAVLLAYITVGVDNFEETEMSDFGIKQTRINSQRHTHVQTCGSCGTEVSTSQLLCEDCKAIPILPGEETWGDRESRTRGAEVYR